MTLEQALRALDGTLTLVPVKGGWQASVQIERSNRVRVNPNPARAVLEALGYEAPKPTPSLFD